MGELNETFRTSCSEEDDSEDTEVSEDSEECEDNSDSDHNLTIDIESPVSPKKIQAKSSNLDEHERDVFANIEDEIERRLEEKAAKTKLNAVNVKNIIRQVVTNEYMLALVRRAENPNDSEETVPVFEPKLTRAKAKELAVPTVPILPAPWESPEPTSEVQVLFTEDLQEDDSGEEYVPVEEGDEVAESEEDADSSTFSSNPPSVEPPPTPPAPTPTPPSPPPPTINWTDDGVFKIPWTKGKEETTDEATIAKRTRSQLSLSSTPLEVIEEAFIPPDITPDMYDMDCCDDDWLDFIKKFAQPLEEVEDEEQDPDFNILADGVIEKPDKDEFRVDKAVKIPRRELDNLIAELFECVDLCPEVQCQSDNVEGGEEVEETRTDVQIRMETLNPSPSIEDRPTMTLDERDIPLLELIEQQMRQHVQMLTQNFILTYEHPELHHHAIQMKEYLLNLKYLAEGKERSMFYTSNLVDALKLLEYWENLLSENNDDVKSMREQISKTTSQCIHAHKTGNTYIVTFPTLIFETISKSCVFLYPWLLPKIPFKPPKIFPEVSKFFSNSEDQLIALGLEQFHSTVTDDNKKKPLKQSLKEACASIREYMMPYKREKTLINHINLCRLSRCKTNPIKHFFHYHKAPTEVQYVISLSQLRVLPPCQRFPDELPYQWKNYVQSQLDKEKEASVPPVTLNSQAIIPVQVVQVVDPYLPPILPKGLITISSIEAHVIPKSKKRVRPNKSNSNKGCSTESSAKKRKQEKSNSDPILNLPNKLNSNQGSSIESSVKKRNSDPISNFVRCLCKPSDIEKILFLFSSGPSLLEETAESETLLVDEGRGESDGSTDERSPSPLNRSEILLDLVMLPSMPNIRTPAKSNPAEEEIDKKPVPIVSEKRTICMEFSTISSSSFQQPNTSTEVEFCSQESSTGCSINQTAEMESLEIDIKPVQLTETVHDDYRNNDFGPKDNLDDINALMSASASTTNKPIIKKEPSGAEKRKAKRKREFLSNLSVSSPEDREAEKQKNELFALAYYDKMRETLELHDYHKIMQILNDYEEGDAVELYKQVEVVLRPKYAELADEFLLFLREKEAAAVDRLIPWIRMSNRSKFLRKLEIYFKDHPAQLRRIYKGLAELSQTVDISNDMIKRTLLPMFKGNEVLSNLFLQNFLNEPPPPSLVEGPYEEMDITKEMSKNDDEEAFETITVPDADDKYGSSTCICSCHEIEDSEFKSRYRHCTKCGTRFINGRVYLQTGKGPRPATVSFLNSSDTDHNSRLMGKSSINLSQRKKRSDNSPSKLVTSFPSKENIDEETDEEGDGKKKTKKQQQRRRKKLPDKSPEDKGARKGSISKKTSPLVGRTKPGGSSMKDFKPSGRKRTNSVKKSPENTKTAENVDAEQEEESILTKPGASPGQQKRVADESLEWGEQSAAGESSCDIKPGSPDQQTADSESEFCEESSQDNCESDSNSSVSSSNNPVDSYIKLQEENSSWKREEDKIILEVFQQENDKDNAFKVIALQLTDRTVAEIKSRFETLMKLLLETIKK